MAVIGGRVWVLGLQSSSALRVRPCRPQRGRASDTRPQVYRSSTTQFKLKVGPVSQTHLSSSSSSSSPQYLFLVPFVGYFAPLILVWLLGLEPRFSQTPSVSEGSPGDARAFLSSPVRCTCVCPCSLPVRSGPPPATPSSCRRYRCEPFPIILTAPTAGCQPGGPSHFPHPSTILMSQETRARRPGM